MGPLPQGWNFEPVKVTKKYTYPFLHQLDFQKRNTPAPGLFQTPDFKNPIRRFDEHFTPEQTFSPGVFGQDISKHFGDRFEGMGNIFPKPVTPSFTTPRMNFDFGNDFNPIQKAGSFPTSFNSFPSWKHENTVDHGESHKTTSGTSDSGPALALFIVALVITLVGCCCCYCCRACCKKKTKNSGRSGATTTEGTVLSSAPSSAANIAVPSNSRGQRPQQVSTNSGVSISSKGMTSASHNMTRDTSASRTLDDTVIIDDLEHGPSAPPLTDIDHGTIGGTSGMNQHAAFGSAFHDPDPPPPYPGLPDSRNDDKV